MKQQALSLSDRLIRQIILMLMFLAFAPLSTAEPYVDYGVSGPLTDTQTTRQFNQRFGFSSSLYRDDLLVPTPLELQQELDTVSVLSDWHPGQGLFRLSAGVLYHPGDEKQKRLRQPYQIQRYLPNIKSGFSGVTTDGLSPYVGFGWGNDLWQRSKLGFNVDMGVLYQPDERLLTEQGGLAFDTKAKSSDSDFLRSLEALELSPVFSLGVSYSF